MLVPKVMMCTVHITLAAAFFMYFCFTNVMLPVVFSNFRYELRCDFTFAARGAYFLRHKDANAFYQH